MVMGAHPKMVLYPRHLLAHDSDPIWIRPIELCQSLPETLIRLRCRNWRHVPFFSGPKEIATCVSSHHWAVERWAGLVGHSNVSPVASCTYWQVHFLTTSTANLELVSLLFYGGTGFLVDAISADQGKVCDHLQTVNLSKTANSCTIQVESWDSQVKYGQSRPNVKM